MANVRFYLNKVKANRLKKLEGKAETLRKEENLKDKREYDIYVRYKLEPYIDKSMKTGFAVRINNWNYEKESVRAKIEVENHRTINTVLSRIKNEINEYEGENIKKNITPTPEEVKTFLKNCISPPPKEIPKPELTLLEYIEFRIEAAKTEKNPSTDKPVSIGTIKSYKLAFKWLKEYHNTVNPISFEGINESFYTDFVTWLEQKNFSKNYIGKLIKNLKYFMNRAVEDGKTNNTEFRKKKFKVTKEKTDSIALSIQELQAIWKVDLSDNPRMDLARDLFLIGAFTGLRVSDYTRLSKKNLVTRNGVKMFKIETQKTEETVAIPLHPIVKEILSKHGNKPPKAMPDQHINNYIKDVGRMAKINSVEVQKRTVGGKKQETTSPRYKLIHTHTGRRSFCTNAFLSGMPTQYIMSISGHATEANFLRYVKATKEQIAMQMSKHAFFIEPKK